MNSDRAKVDSSLKNGFFKGHALGNDYIVMDPANLDCQLDPRTIRAICDRNRGVGADGIIGIGTSSKADFGISIYNADGSEAETSGNGLRIFALYAFQAAKANGPSFLVETKAGISRVRLEVDWEGDVTAISASMGRASFTPTDLPCTLMTPELVGAEVSVQGRRLSFTGVSVGNPHCVVFSDEGENWTPDDLLRLGPQLESNPLFPNRVNVQLASVESQTAINILIWERGSGETLASGSSSCAAASAAVRLGLVRSPVTVNAPGGSVSIDVDDEFNLTLTGPVSSVCQGTLSSSFIKTVNAAS